MRLAQLRRTKRLQPRTVCGPELETSMRIALAAIAILAATPVLAEDLVFTLVNDSSHIITEMYVSAVDQDQWGENILTVDAVDPGVSGDVTIADGLVVCDYDLRFVTDEGAEAEKTQNLCEIATFTVSD
jgi:hypothetical protein